MASVFGVFFEEKIVGCCYVIVIVRVETSDEIILVYVVMSEFLYDFIVDRYLIETDDDAKWD